MRNNKIDYSWETDIERIRRHMSISPKKKLIWLKEINDLTWSARSLKQKHIYWQQRLKMYE